MSRLTLSLLLAMCVMMLSLFLYAEDVYEATNDAAMAWLRQAYRVASALLAAPVVLLLGGPLLSRALARLRAHRLSMELLIASGAISAFGLSLWALIRGGSTIYFDSVVAALVLATVGRYLEANARRRAAGLVAPLVDAKPEPVLAGVRREDLRELPAQQIEPGMWVEVAPDQMVPVDVEATSEARVDLSALTGESRLVAVREGDPVPAGAIVCRRALSGRALRAARESTMRRLDDLTRGLRQRRGSTERLADRFASWMVPVVWLVAGAALVWWTRSAGVAHGVEVALAVVLVACPCTYGVMVPLLNWLALRHALRHGVCLRGADVLEKLAGVRAVAFDKTGTLSEPRAAASLELLGTVSEVQAWTAIAALEEGVRHPLARSFRDAAAMNGAAVAAWSEREVLTGRGVLGRDDDGAIWRLGSWWWLDSCGVDVSGQDEAAALLAREGELVAAVVVDEALRREAAEALEELRSLAVVSEMVTGDREARARPIAQALSIPLAAELGPEAKVARLADLPQPAALAGDGINDGPALAAAPVGIAVGGATALARGVADVVLLERDLRLIPFAITLARKTVTRGYGALIAATAYNVVFVTLAALGLLRPVWAGLSMLLASLLVLASVVGVTASRPRADATPLKPEEAAA